jgi:hypothetical protein
MNTFMQSTASLCRIAPTLISRRCWLPMAIATAAALLAACAGLGGPRSLVVSEAELNQRLQRQLPIERRVLELLTVRLSEPQLRLLPQDGRVALELDVNAADRLFGRAYQGHIAVDFGLRYDEAAQAIQLQQVRVQQFQIAQLPAREQAQVRRIGGLIAEHLLKDLAIYRFRPQDLKTAEGLGYAPGAISVTARGLEVSLVPLRR